MDAFGIECRRLALEWRDALGAFFDALVLSGDDQYFHPHSLKQEEVTRLCNYSGRDLYYILVANRDVLGYGMLRGWDAGYDIPSLGIAIHPSWRGRGLGKGFMSFLHMSAQYRGAVQIRLKVYPNNKEAINMYRGLGYIFGKVEEGQLVGLVDLS